MTPRPHHRLALDRPDQALIVSALLCPQRSASFFAMLWSSVFLTFLAACDRKPDTTSRAQPQTATSGKDVVAVVGAAVITREAFQAELRRLGEVRSKEAVLEDMIRFETLLAKARAAGYDHDPAVVASVNRMIAARFQEDQLATHNGPDLTVSEEEVLDYYHKNAETFATAERVRAAVIFWKGSPRATPEKKSELLARVEAVLTEARHTNAAGFAGLVQKYSEDQASRYRGGDAGWLRRDEPGAGWDAMLIDQVFGLATPGDLSPIMSTQSGLYIARLVERIPADVLPLDQVKDRIAYAISQQRRQRLEEQFFDRMKAGLMIEINRPLLQSIQTPTLVVENKPPSMPPE